jgi:hypothetical protein
MICTGRIKKKGDYWVIYRVVKFLTKAVLSESKRRDRGMYRARATYVEAGRQIQIVHVKHSDSSPSVRHPHHGRDIQENMFGLPIWVWLHT